MVLIDAGAQRAPVFLPVVASTSTSHSYRLTGAVWRPGDVISRVVAVDIDRPRLPVTYRIIDDSPTSSAFDISQSGVVTLASNTSRLRGLTDVNVTVQAAVAGNSITSSKLLRFELIDWRGSSSGSDVGGLWWQCVWPQYAAVMENSPRDTRVTRLTAHSADNDSLIYHIVNGDPQHAFSIDPITVYITDPTCPVKRPPKDIKITL